MKGPQGVNGAFDGSSGDLLLAGQRGSVGLHQLRGFPRVQSRRLGGQRRSTAMFDGSSDDL